jgi:hypothetical protein
MWAQDLAMTPQSDYRASCHNLDSAPPVEQDTLGSSNETQYQKKFGLNRDLNPGPPAPKAGIIPLDH